MFRVLIIHLRKEKGFRLIRVCTEEKKGQRARVQNLEFRGYIGSRLIRV